MSETYKDREVRCYFGILNIKGLMDTDNKMVEDIEDYGEVRLPLFSHQTYKIKTTFNKNLQYQNTFINSIDMTGNDIIIRKPTSHYGVLHFADTTNPYEGKYYQKKFRRQVLWDFGDGTKIQGYSAQHAYKKPGRYKITCTFFDINRQAWVNNYCIYVVVKEVIPTMLRFANPTNSKNSIKCSKIQKISQLEALVSNTVDDELNVNVKRIFSQGEYNENYEEINRKFDTLQKTPFRFMEKSWLFMENTQVLYYNSDKIYMNYVQPTDIFHPNYQNLYGKFFYNQQMNRIDFSFYQIIPFKQIDEKLKTITILDPNERIIPDPNPPKDQFGNIIKDVLVDEQGNTEIITYPKEFYIEEKYKTYRITQLYVEDVLPQDCFYVGKRGFFDIFYKNDYISGKDHTNKISIFYDIENTNITGELKSAPNYLNINPLGLNINIENNSIDDVKFGISLDCFIRQVQENDDYTTARKDMFAEKGVVYNEKTYIDPHFYNSLIKGIDLDSFVFPYIPYGNSEYNIYGTPFVVDGQESGWTPYNNAYYIPKDVVLNISDTRMIHNGHGDGSFINTGVQMDEFGNIIEFGSGEVMQSVYPWLYRIPFILRDYIDIILNITYGIEDKQGFIKSRIKKMQNLDTNAVVIPKEIQYKQDIDRLLRVYMGHPMFDETENIRDMFKAFLSNNLLDYIMTRSKNFLDDTANIKTCYLSNLISTLKMMGQDVTEYEKSAFEGVNDLKNFVRLLSMNHGDLVGHVIYGDLDIKISNDMKGKNVGAQIGVSDILYLNNNKQSEHLGKILGLKRHGAETRAKLNLDDQTVKDGLQIIVHDKYTHETRVVSLMQMQKHRIANDEEIVSNVKLEQYQDWWDWNLLLPDRFKNARQKQREYAEKRLKVDLYGPGRLRFFAEEEQRMKQICRDMITGYYSFYILDPRRQTKRVGNFIDDSYITQRVQKLSSWEEVWGITHEVLMKILFENGKLFNNRNFNIIEVGEDDEEDQEEFITTGDIYIHKEFDQGELVYDLFVNGERKNDMKVGGSVVLKGTILGVGTNYLTFSLENGIIDRYFPFSNYANNKLFEVNVNKDGSIATNTETFNVVGKNIQGVVTITLSGTVANPKMSVESTIYFIDDRINPIEVEIIKHYKTQFYTNLKRAELDSTAIEDGLVDNTDDEKLGKKFDVRLRWEDTPKIGSNKAFLSVEFDAGQLYYKEATAASEAYVWGNDAHVGSFGYTNNDYKTFIVVQQDGSLYFAHEDESGTLNRVEAEVFDISSVGAGDNPVLGEVQYQSGKIYCVLSGNVMGTEAAKPRLNCYTYNPFTEEPTEVATRLLGDVGGYSFKITEKEEGTDSYFNVNGRDGFAQGYYIIIASPGHSVHSPFIYRNFWVKEKVYIFDSNDRLVRTLASPDRTIKVSVDNNGVISQDDYTNTYVNNSTVSINTNGGYYQVTGYKISVNI